MRRLVAIGHEESVEGDADSSTPERIRTSDQRFRKPLLYPAELRGQQLSCNILQRPTQVKSQASLSETVSIGVRIDHDAGQVVQEGIGIQVIVRIRSPERLWRVRSDQDTLPPGTPGALLSNSGYSAVARSNSFFKYGRISRVPEGGSG
jgi:hypothetical protein